MSYEGYVQVLCENGHLFVTDAYYDEQTLVCSRCPASGVFFNHVDETNGPPQGEIPAEEWKQFEIAPERKERCNLGHEHVLEYARYRVPTAEELEKVRKYYEE